MAKSDSNTTNLSMADILLKTFLSQNLGPAADYLPSTVSGMSGLSKGMRNEFFESEVSPSNLVHSIDADLRDTTKYDYDEMEVDALRHYLGTQALARKYGPKNAEIFGYINEMLNYAGSGKEQADIDIKNNKKALDDFKANKQLKEYDKAILDSLLKEITIPPVPGYLEDTSFNR